MNRNELIKNLEYTKQKYENKFVSTGETNIYIMISDVLRYLNQPTTEINIDYYEELKAKADAYDKIMALTGTNDARLELTDKGAEELRRYLDKVREVIR